MTRQWIRQYRCESGSFAQLPLVARGLFREILGLTDDTGVVQLGGKTPAEAVAFALGATESDRRALRKAIPLLLSDGCLRVVGDTIVAPNFARFQNDAMASRASRVLNDSVTTPERLPNDSVTRSEVSARKDTLAQNVLLSESRVEESRVEESRGDLSTRETPTVALSLEEREKPTQVAYARANVRGEYIRRGYEARFKAFYAGRKPAVKPPREVAELTCPLWGRLAAELDDEAAADVFLDRAFAHAFLTKRGHRPSLLEEMRVEILAGDPRAADEVSDAESEHPLKTAWLSAEKAARSALMSGAPPEVLRPLERAEEAALDAWKAVRR